MRTLSACELLDVWEKGQSQHPLDKAVTLLAAACPEMGRDELTRLSLGQRDRLLFNLRRLSLGPDLETYAECPACRAEMELVINIDNLLAQAVVPQKTEWVEDIGEYSVCFRLPDIALIAECLNSAVSSDSDFLLKKCILSVTRNGENIGFNAIKDELKGELDSLMSRIDPLSEVQIASTCTACGYRWTQTLDIFSFFWSEIGLQVTHLMDQVHLLARSYSWTERDILSLSPWRRQYYMERVTS